MSSQQDEHSSDEESFEIIDNVDEKDPSDNERSDDDRNDKMATELSMADFKSVLGGIVDRCSGKETRAMEMIIDKAEKEQSQLIQQRALNREKEARIVELEEKVKNLDRKCHDQNQRRREEMARVDETIIRMQEALDDAVADNKPLLKRIEQLKALNGAAGDEILELKMANKQLGKAYEKLDKRMHKLRSVDLTLLTTDEKRVDRDFDFTAFLVILLVLNCFPTLILFSSPMTFPFGLFACFCTFGMATCLYSWSYSEMPVAERKTKMRKLLQELNDCAQPIANPTPVVKVAIKKADASSPKDDVDTPDDVANSEVDVTAVELHRTKNGRFGLGLMATSVASVDKGSAADTEGVVEGDEIVSINGVSATTMSGTQMKKVMTTGRAVTLQLRHNPDLLVERKTKVLMWQRKF